MQETEAEFENLDIANAEQKEKIAVIEKMNIGTAQRAELVLVLLGVKPTTDVTVFPWNDTPEDVCNSLGTMGFVVREKKRDARDGGDQERKRLEFSVGRRQEDVDQLLSSDPAKDHEIFGRLMGFPESAVQAFQGQTDLLEHDQYPSMKGIIFEFALSKDNWAHEYKLLTYWSRLIEKYAPSIYRELSGGE